MTTDGYQEETPHRRRRVLRYPPDHETGGVQTVTARDPAADCGVKQRRTCLNECNLVNTSTARISVTIYFVVGETTITWFGDFDPIWDRPNAPFDGNHVTNDANDATWWYPFA